MILLLFIFIASGGIYGSEAFSELRDFQLGSTADFSGELESSSADKLIAGRVKKPYRVVVNYSSRSGLELVVEDAEPFYRNMLESYYRYVNNIIFPILDSAAYNRLQKRFKSESKNGVHHLSFRRGDDDIRYEMKTGRQGLVDEIEYFENGKKIYYLRLSWVDMGGKYAVSEVKSVSYLKTRQAADFKVKNILVLE